MVSNNIIQNCPSTASVITNAHTMLGPKLFGTWGNTLWLKLDKGVVDYIDVPWEFLKWHNFVAIVKDVVFLNNLSFLITIYRGINLWLLNTCALLWLRKWVNT